VFALPIISGKHSTIILFRRRIMTTSPAPSAAAPRTELPSDVFERLAQSKSFLTAKEVAQLLSISPKTVYAYVGRNMIPHYKIETSVRFRPKDLAEWLRRHAVWVLP
jgi:excisionase family DNA binding protein